MGTIADCAAMGIPEDLLIPVLPPTAGWKVRNGRNPNGKVPARFMHDKGYWTTLMNWPMGCAPAERHISDEWNCNAGLLLGQPVEGKSYAVLDGDLTDDSQGANRKLRPMIIGHLAAAFGVAGIMVRDTIEPRFMVVVELDTKGDVGGRQVIQWEYRDPAGNKLSLGKLELLTRGEQAVIAGRHISGNVISWSNSARPTRKFLAPKMDEGVVKFAGFSAFSTAVLTALKPFEKGGIFATAASVSSRSLVGASRLPHDLAPRDARTFVELVDRMQNPANIGYHEYINFWYALEGCRRSLRTLDRLTPADDLEMVRAGVDWAGRWPPPPGKARKTRDEEIALATYVSQAPLVSLGWGYLKALAVDCGVVEIGVEEAQREFIADQPLPPPKRLKIWTDPDPDKRMPTTQATEEQLAPTAETGRGLEPGFRAGPRKHDSDGINVPLSDIQIADHLELELSGKVVWLADEKRWLTYQPPLGWIGDEAADSRVEIEIEEMLRAYTARWADSGPSASEKWTRSERNSALSTQRVNAVLKRLSKRFSKGRRQIDLGQYVLQTPDGAVDLRTGIVLNEREQKRLIDTRRTNCGIKPGETKLFDELIYNLSDGNPDVVEYILHYLGYCLLGVPKARVFLFIWGTTGNGKSALVRILQRIFGNYVVVLNTDVLLERGKNMHKTDLYRIRGARIACAVEMPPNEKWDERLIKAITGGDEISARMIAKDAKSFAVECAMLLVGNNIPAFDRVDQAIAARARITGTTFTPPKPDPTWEDRMVEGEGPAIVAKLGGYAKAVYHNDMTLPEVPVTMARQTRVYLGEQDKFFAWATGELNLGYDYRDEETPILELKKRFEAFLKREADQAEDSVSVADKIGDKTFMAHLRSIGLKLESDNDGKRLQRIASLDGAKGTVYVARGCAFKIRVVQSA